MNFSNYAKDNENVKIKMENISVDERTSLSHAQESLTCRDGTDSFIRRAVLYGAIRKPSTERRHQFCSDCLDFVQCS
jgi:hypothetical protein